MVMTILMVSILQETDGVLLESYLIYEPEHQVIIIDLILKKFDHVCQYGSITTSSMNLTIK